MLKKRVVLTAGSAALGGLAAALVVALAAGAHTSTTSSGQTRSGEARVLANYRVFRKTTRAVVALPPQAQRLERALITNGAGVAPGVRTGQPIPGSERLLFAKPGAVANDVFGVAMSAGGACLFIPGVMAGCDRGTQQTEPVAWLSGGPAGGPGIIAGLARDGVRGVDVIVSGQALPASFANNAFYRELSLTDLRQASALAVTMIDGSIVSINLPSLG